MLRSREVSCLSSDDLHYVGAFLLVLMISRSFQERVQVTSELREGCWLKRTDVVGECKLSQLQFSYISASLKMHLLLWLRQTSSDQFNPVYQACASGLLQNIAIVESKVRKKKKPIYHSTSTRSRN